MCLVSFVGRIKSISLYLFIHVNENMIFPKRRAQDVAALCCVGEGGWGSIVLQMWAQETQSYMLTSDDDATACVPPQI